MATEKRMTKDGRYVLRPGEYERKSKRGFEFKYRDEHGHQHTLGALTIKELREKERAIQKDKLDGISTSKQRNSLNDFYALWKRQSRGLKANTFSNYTWMYDTFVSQTLGKMKIRDIRESDVREFYNNLLDKGMSVNTLDNIQTILHQVLDMALKDDAIRRNVSDDALKKLKQLHPREKKKALTPAELARLRAVIAGTVWYPVFEILSWTGMRVGEICGLTWDDVDYQNGVLHINKTLVYYKDNESNTMVWTINTTKTAASFRDLPLNDHIIAALEFQKANCPRCTAIVDGVNDFIFGTRFGGTQHQGTLNKALRRIVRDANAEKDAPIVMPYLSCHTLRRTYATNLARAGVSIPVTMALLGHTDYETTVSVYTDVQMDMREKGDAQLRAWMHGEIVEEDKKIRSEYEELRRMAEEAAGMKRMAADVLKVAGKLTDAEIEKMKDRGIPVSEIEEMMAKQAEHKAEDDEVAYMTRFAKDLIRKTGKLDAVTIDKLRSRGIDAEALMAEVKAEP